MHPQIPRTESYTTTFTPAEAERLRDFADSQERSVAAVMRLAVNKYVKDQSSKEAR